MTVVEYRKTGDAFTEFDQIVIDLVKKNGFRSICEVGGGANPLLSLEFIQQNALEYTILDISQEELDKSPEGYLKLCGDITGEVPFVPEQFDFVFSKMLAEHVIDGRRFHQNVFDILKPGGFAFHFFPTLYAFPFLLNFVIPESFGHFLLKTFNPERLASGMTNKFPAHYSWTRGPTKNQIAKLQSVGFEIESYIGLVGHDGYYRRLKPILAIHRAFANAIIKSKLSAFTSYAFLIMRKPS